MSQPIVISSGPAMSAGFSSSKSQSSASDRDVVDAAPQSVAPQDVAPQDVAPQDVAPQEVAPESVAVVCGSLRGRFLIAEERVLVEGAPCSLLHLLSGCLLLSACSQLRLRTLPTNYLYLLALTADVSRATDSGGVKELRPNEFERQGGRASSKKWKASIKVLLPNGQSGVPISTWLARRGTPFQARSHQRSAFSITLPWRFMASL